MVTLTRREREKVEMRQLIVDAAIKMYLEEGYEKLTLRSIAQRIEYSVGTIYLYFKDKDELFHAMHEWAFDRLYKEFDALRSIENPLERLENISRVYIKFAFDNPELYDLMFILHEPMCAHQNMDEWPCGQKTYLALRETVEECFEKGFLKGENADVMSFMFWSSIHGMLALNMRNRLRMYEGMDLKFLISHTTELIFKQFLK
jgi:AcrR family transcriptional regulator